MNHDNSELRARIIALEITLEMAYALAIRQMKDPEREVGILCDAFENCARQLAQGGEEPHVPQADGEGVAAALSDITRRIRARVELRPQDLIREAGPQFGGSGAMH